MFLRISSRIFQPSLEWMLYNVPCQKYSQYKLDPKWIKNPKTKKKLKNEFGSNNFFQSNHRSNGAHCLVTIYFDFDERVGLLIFKHFTKVQSSSVESNAITQNTHFDLEKIRIFYFLSIWFECLVIPYPNVHTIAVL